MRVRYSDVQRLGSGHVAVAKTLKDAASYPQNSRDMTLGRMRRATEGKKWTERVETDLLMQRLRVLLGW